MYNLSYRFYLEKKVLDLSYNKLSVIEGLAGLPIQELNLRGNLLCTLSHLGVEYLPCLSVLDLAENKIECLSSFETCSKLEVLDIRSNNIGVIRQVEFLGKIPWLRVLLLGENPCAKKPFYRSRVIYRLLKLTRLDLTHVSADEKIRSFNLYQCEGGDLPSRIDSFSRHFPEDTENFTVYSEPVVDDEINLTEGDLLQQTPQEFLRNSVTHQAIALVEGIIHRATTP